MSIHFLIGKGNNILPLFCRKYVKDEKAVREDIVRMSSKPMLRVQEDIAALRQLLSVVSNGLQRNTCILEKLKAEMIQVWGLVYATHYLIVQYKHQKGSCVLCDGQRLPCKIVRRVSVYCMIVSKMVVV